MTHHHTSSFLICYKNKDEQLTKDFCKEFAHAHQEFYTSKSAGDCFVATDVNRESTHSFIEVAIMVRDFIKENAKFKDNIEVLDLFHDKKTSEVETLKNFVM